MGRASCTLCSTAPFTTLASTARVVEGYPIEMSGATGEVRVDITSGYVGTTALFERAGSERAMKTVAHGGGRSLSGWIRILCGSHQQYTSQRRRADGLSSAGGVSFFSCDAKSTPGATIASIASRTSALSTVSAAAN